MAMDMLSFLLYFLFPEHYHEALRDFQKQQFLLVHLVSQQMQLQ